MEGKSIAFPGSETLVMWGSEERTLLPLVVAGGNGLLSNLGIGVLIDNATTACWATVIPHNLIQAWRAREILQSLAAYSSDMLAASMTIAKRELICEDGEARRAFECLAFGTGGYAGARALRERVLRMAPGADELELMIAHLYVADIHVDARELEEELALGLIERTPFVDLAICAEAVWIQEYDRKHKPEPERQPERRLWHWRTPIAA